MAQFWGRLTMVRRIWNLSMVRIVCSGLSNIQPVSQFSWKIFNSCLLQQMSGVTYRVKVTAVVKPIAPEWASVSLLEDGGLFYSRKILFLPLFFLKKSYNITQSEGDSKELMNCKYMFHVPCVNQMYKFLF